MVITGEVELVERGGSTRTYRAGESFVVQRGIVHEGRNVGASTAELAITYVLDRGAPLRVPVP
jgi:quercetin dioxygenase-like cupin family protein